MVETRAFEFFVRAVLCLNVAAQMSKTYNQSALADLVLFYIGVFFAIFYWFEATSKLLAYGPHFYFTDDTNKFDFFVCCLSSFSIILDLSDPDTSDNNSPSASSNELAKRIFHAINVVRALRLLRFTKGLREMMNTLFQSLSSIANLGCLTCLILLIFAILGNNFFYNVNLSPDPYQRMGAYGWPVVKYASYATLDNAIFLVFRITTGDAWNGIMYYSAGTLPVSPAFLCSK